MNTNFPTLPSVDIAYAQELDRKDPLKKYRDAFWFPRQANGQKKIYFNGNSLGLQPKITRSIINRELKHWSQYGVKGHFEGPNPWIPYHSKLGPAMAALVGAKPAEVIIMNTLTVNLHLMMATFYRPTAQRYKVMMEADAFPSDRFAVESQLKIHGFDPKESIIYVTPPPGSHLLDQEQVLATIERHQDEVALVLFGVPNYYTGQVIDMKPIVEVCQKVGIKVGFNLAHAVGNIPLHLHDDGADFAIWCTYKYMNGGPGNLSGCFIHERHAYNKELPRLAGWWGQHLDKRFNMRLDFDPAPGAEGWCISNAPVLQLAALEGTLALFLEVGMPALREKSLKLTGYLAYVLNRMVQDSIEVISPISQNERGCQLSISVKNGSRSLYQKLTEAGVVTDWRDPDVIRAAPCPFYNTFEEVFRFATILRSLL